jgi:serine phosphatase RsbU (regulator of sigma subunit)/DNA-binding response OmpR family regulator/anti-sigma regulatory factor (Ser/Thr protein kinase)
MPADEPREEKTISGHTILVVDDDHQLASTLAEFLETQGYRVRVALSAAAAATLLDREPVALVILDLHLPDANGVDLMQRLRSLKWAPDVLVMTGHATLDSAVAAVEAQAAGFLLKPLSLEQVGTAVQRVIDRRGFSPDLARRSSEMADRLREAEALVAISATLADTLDLDEALRRICRELVRLTGADTAAAYLLDPEQNVLAPCVAYHVPKQHLERLAASNIPLREEGFYLPLWTDHQPVWTDDVAEDHRFHHALFRQIPHQSGLLLPLVLDADVAGTFYVVWWKGRRAFSDHELVVLKHICEQVSSLLRTARLFERTNAYNDAFRNLVASELRVAREVQSSALPHEFEALAAGTGLEIHAVMEAAREVGGDLYDVLRLPEDRLFIVLGDVSGKGIPAAMFMMSTAALLRVAASGGLQPPQLLARLNDQLCADNSTSMFVTLTCAVADGVTGDVRYAMAGHTAPVLLTAAGEPRLLDGDRGTVAGVERGLTFPSATVRLEPGDTLLLYSDGVTESFDSQGRVFGEDGLLTALAGLSGASARSVVERLREAIRAFAADAEPSDDIAILAVHRAGVPPLTLEVPASPCAVVQATDQVRAWCEAANIPTAAIHDLALAFEEAGVNVAVHALAERPDASFRVRLARRGAEAVLEIRDPGAPFNPLEEQPPVMAATCGGQRVGGLGIHLVRGVMTRVAWTREGMENVLTLTRALDT